jgi:hypothetical protein
MENNPQLLKPVKAAVRHGAAGALTTKGNDDE